MQATVAELEAVGPERASLRSIARRVGMTHQAVAYHFADRTALLTEVAIEGFRELEREIRAAADALVNAADPAAPVAAVGKAYVGFARANRARFDLMFRSRHSEASDPRLLTAQLATFDVLLSRVQEASARGWAPGAEPERLAVACWSAVHGLATLEGSFAALPAVDPDEVIDMLSDLIIAQGR